LHERFRGLKVAFLIHSLEVNSCRYRVLQYLPYFRKEGVDVSVHFYKRNGLDKLKFYNTLGQYDIFYVHRRLFPPVEFWYLRRKAKRIIYDFDDALMYRSSGARNSHSFSRRFRFAHMMRGVDFVVAGNQFLRSQVVRYNRNVEVIPTSIDLSHYSIKEGSPSEGPITIGWLGSSSTLKYLKGVLPTLERIFRGHPCFQLKIVCDQFLDSPCLPIIKKRWSEEEETTDLKSFDIGIMPLSDDLWSRGKCGLKILQYQGAGVPVVCTPVGVNRDIITHGINGFWAGDEDQWEKGLLKLIQEEGLRRAMGLEGRKAVERGYSVDINAPRLLDLLKRVSTTRGFEK